MRYPKCSSRLRCFNRTLPAHVPIISNHLLSIRRCCSECAHWKLKSGYPNNPKHVHYQYVVKEIPWKIPAYFHSNCQDILTNFQFFRLFGRMDDRACQEWSGRAGFDWMAFLAASVVCGGCLGPPRCLNFEANKKNILKILNISETKSLQHFENGMGREDRLRFGRGILDCLFGTLILIVWMRVVGYLFMGGFVEAEVSSIFPYNSWWRSVF